MGVNIFTGNSKGKQVAPVARGVLALTNDGWKQWRIGHKIQNYLRGSQVIFFIPPLLGSELGKLTGRLVDF